MTFRFGYSGSTFGGVDELVDTAVRAERAGFDSFLVADLPGGLSPFVALAAVAHATSTITLGTFVLAAGLWDPRTIARELASLDRVSGGRTEIGLGTGLPLPPLAGIIPPTRAERVTRLVETVEALEAAFEQPGLAPAFVARPRVLVAGSGDRIVRLVGERADGFVIASIPPEPKVQLPPGQLVLPELTATERYVERVRAAAGERASRLVLGTGAAVVLTDDADAAAQDLAGIHTYLTPEQIRTSPKILIGTAAEVAAQVVERAEGYGLTYQVLRGASPEELGAVIERVRRTV